MTAVYRSVTGWRHACEAVLSLGCRLSDAHWAAPTECPRWTVKDVYCHLIGGEQWMAAGHPQPEGYEEWAAGPVLARREATPPAILTELREAYEQRRFQLDRDRVYPDQPACLPTGETTTLGRLLQSRVFDLWVHEQDIRRAVGQPGNLASPGAAAAGEMLVTFLPRIVAKSAQAPPGSTVRLTTTGEVAIDVAVAVDRAGRGALASPGRPALAHLTMSWESYARLSAGRGSRADHDVRITGDRALAERILTHLVITR